MVALANGQLRELDKKLLSSDQDGLYFCAKNL